MGIKQHVRDLSAKAELLGFRFDGFTKSGHTRFYNPDIDVLAICSATPSDHRSINNELARMERLSGRKLPREKSGRHHFRPVKQAMDVRRSRVERESLEQIDTLLGRASELQSRWGELLASPPSRNNAIEAREVIAEYETVRSGLQRLHRLIPPLTAS